jgi:hypothetical protein
MVEMTINPENFRDYFYSLADDQLRDFPWQQWVDAARAVYEAELSARSLVVPEEVPHPTPGDPPDWLDTAVSACGFYSTPGTPKAKDAEQARDLLQAAGLPCHLSVERVDPDAGGPQPQYEYLVMVPGSQMLLATSILDREIFNVTEEATWKTHLEELSDEDLRALDPQLICAGILDRADRLQNAYEDELARREP